MGLKGLQTYIAKYTQGALEDHLLRFCRVLIDGNNLMHYLLEHHTKLNPLFGGDYDEFVKQIDLFFNALHYCEVESCVIMDGDVALKKSSMEGAINKFRNKTAQAMDIHVDQLEKTKFTPPLCLEVFVAAVRRHGVTVLQADDVADDEIVTIAVTYGLPVLSSDADYCLRGVAVITFSSLNYTEILETKKKCIQCQKFNTDKFCKLLDINSSHLLFVDALGMRDFIKKFHLLDFIRSITQDNSMNLHGPWMWHRLDAVVKWLSSNKEKSVAQLVDEVVQRLPRYHNTKKQEGLRMILSRMVRVSLYASKLLSWFCCGPDDHPCGHAAFTSACVLGTDGYTVTEATVAKFAEKKRTCQDRSVRQFSTVDEMNKVTSGQCPHGATNHSFAGGLPVPDWFAVSHKQMFFQRQAAELFVNKVIFTAPLVEKLNRKSAYLIALPLVQIMLAISEKTFREHESSYLQKQLDMLERSGTGEDRELVETIKNQILNKVDHIQYEKHLRKLRNKKRKLEIANQSSTVNIDKLILMRKKEIDAARWKRKRKSRKIKTVKVVQNVTGGNDISKPEPELRTAPAVDTPYQEKTSKKGVEDYLTWFHHANLHRAPAEDASSAEQSICDTKETSHATTDQPRAVGKEKVGRSTEHTSLDELEDQRTKDMTVSTDSRCPSHDEQNKKDPTVGTDDESDDCMDEEELLNIPMHELKGVPEDIDEQLDDSEYQYPENNKSSGEKNAVTGQYYGPTNTVAYGRYDSDADVIIESDSESDPEAVSNAPEPNSTMQQDDSGADVTVETGSEGDADVSEANLVGCEVACTESGSHSDGDGEAVEDIESQHGSGQLQSNHRDQVENDCGDDDIVDTVGKYEPDNEERVPGMSGNSDEKAFETKKGTKKTADKPVRQMERVSWKPKNKKNDQGNKPGKKTNNKSRIDDCVLDPNIEVEPTANEEFVIELTEEGFAELRIFRKDFSSQLEAKLLENFEKLKKKSEISLKKFQDFLKVATDELEIAQRRACLLNKLNWKLVTLMRPALELECDQIIDKELLVNFDGDIKNELFIKKDDEKTEIVPYGERPLKWYMRKSFLTKIIVLKVVNESSLLTVPSLQSLGAMGVMKRKTLLCEFLGHSLNSFNGLPNDIQLVMLIICYWYKNSSFPVNRCHVYTLLLSFIMFYYIDSVTGKLRDEEALDSFIRKELNKNKKIAKEDIRIYSFKLRTPVGRISSIAKELDGYACALAAKNLLDYHQVNLTEKKSLIYKKHIVQSISEFQACFTYVDSLNSVLGNPFLLPSIDVVVNGMFAYNAFLELSRCTDQAQVLVPRLGWNKQMTFLLDAMHRFVKDLLELPNVLNLFPRQEVTYNDDGEKVVRFVPYINIKKNLLKEETRIEKKKEMEEIDELVKEFETLDLKIERKKKFLKKKEEFED